jgi:hypothetical protein
MPVTSRTSQSLPTFTRVLGQVTAVGILSAVLGAGALSAQDFQRPDGWMTRFDNPDATEDQLEMFVAMPPGWHITSGPAAIYYAPDQTASGDFRAELEVYLFDPGDRREAFGIFVGGRDLQGAGQEYSYFLIRNGGQYIVKRREGADAPTVRPWTSHDAILSYADRGDEASIKNVLAVEARGDQVHLFVNDEEVATLPRSDFAVDGTYGFRVNHGLNLHVSRLEVRPLE